MLLEMALIMAHSRELSTCVAPGWGMAWDPVSISRGVLGSRNALQLKCIIAVGPEGQKLVVSPSGGKIQL